MNIRGDRYKKQNYTGNFTRNIGGRFCRLGKCGDVYGNKINNSNDGVCNADCSLREAVAAADSGDTVVFNPGLIGQTFALGGSEIVITKRITIDGMIDSVNVAFISGSGMSRHFYIQNGAALDLRNAILVQDNGVGINGIDQRGGAISG